MRWEPWGCGSQSFLRPVPMNAEALSGMQGQGEVRSSWDLFRGSVVESRSLGPDFGTSVPAVG